MLSFNSADVILYFWNSTCSVCGPLYDKLEILVADNYPELKLEKINISNHPELRSQFGVFSSPLIILLLDGKEYLRSSGSVSIHELKHKIDRLYALRFS